MFGGNYNFSGRFHIDREPTSIMYILKGAYGGGFTFLVRVLVQTA
jgi:hypothetical protein